MSDFCYFLDHYPLKECYATCGEYLRHHIDWDAKSKEIREKGAIYFDVSDVISLFPHLDLDENYQLICYLSSEYHGLWGRVAAIEVGADKTPVFNPKDEWLSKLFHGKHFELPENAAPPMEAIYNDGSPEGYFEAILCKHFLAAIPYARYEKECWDFILAEPPIDLNKAWDLRVDIPDWRPRAIANSRPNTIIAFHVEIENGLGSSSGRDRIYLTEYYFQEKLGFYHSFAAKNDRSMYHGQIDNDKRYTEKRHCCVSSESSVLIAQEKHYNAKV